MGKRLKIILSVLVVLLVISVIISWQIIKSSPQYSIYQLYQAINQHDYKKFQQFVDVEGLSNNVFDKVLASVTEESKKDVSNLGQSIGWGLITFMEPKFKEEMISGIQKEVEQGDFKKEYQPKGIFDYLNAVEVKKSGKV